MTGPVSVSVMTGLLIACLLTVASAAADSTLRQVNLVYRHGDRSPILIFPTDPNQEDKWPQGLGWLSKTGVQQHHRLGQWLRKRYMEDQSFMNSSYRHEEIKIHSSDEDRCLMSAYSDLSGLYPPTDAEKFDSSIPWQPIPVHTRPAYEDHVLNMGEACPTYEKVYAETLRSHAVKKEEQENKAFYQFVGNKTGWDHENISNIWRIADTMFCEKAHNLTLASWANDTVYGQLRELLAYAFVLMFQQPELHRLKGGPLLAKYIQNMQVKAANSSAVQTKMFMYSAHDTTVAALLSALGLYDGKSPEYTATVISELHEMKPSSFIVRLFYKNVTDGDTAYQLTLPGCKADCPLDDFVRLTKPSVPVDWRKECGLPPAGSSSSSQSGLSTAWIIAIVEGVMVVLLMVFVVVIVVRWRKSGGGTFKRMDIPA